ncbi:MAG: C4-dicarboxylate ABC transporter [Proteobacteria bacterium]|nr:MAG: C4-dicarboxylate ABC transporter [Pseudomonadota bacterium]PIE40181.1 MAG: C4-dicarboxylate ABC transporter [Gammaproteobacteria bacterium]
MSTLTPGEKNDLDKNELKDNPSPSHAASTGVQAKTGTIDDLLASETGGRMNTGLAGMILTAVPFCWSLFQVWIASPLPFEFNVFVFNEDEAKFIHLAFALFLAFAAFPALKGRMGKGVPVLDWVLALLAACSVLYLLVFRNDLAERAGAPTTVDIVVAVIGMLLLLEATRRVLGLPLMIVAIFFLVYTFGGPYMPDVIAHKGASLSKVMSHQWLTTEGVFGIALGVSTSFVFLFVLFGALLEKAGAGNYFIKVAYSLLGHMRGGPAKAAVVSSGLSGLISGSSIANVVTTGTFTIPLMKRVGFPPVKAGAVEVAASTNGQLTPPIMGAAAFLMVEYVGISYLDVIKHAALPALISYVALVYIVHLEAVKLGMQGIERKVTATVAQKMLSFLTVFIGMMLLTVVVYFGLGWIKGVAGDSTWLVASALFCLAYLFLVRLASTVPQLKVDDPKADITELPEVGPTVRSGLHFLLPVVVLVWMLAVERFSPALSAFWATVSMIFIVLTQRPLFAFFRKKGSLVVALKDGGADCFEAMVNGARNMVGIGVATATAGIVVGTVTLTGVGLVMTEFVEFISGGSMLLMLIFTAGISLILGMGLPTTANYIVVSTLMAPVIVTLGAQHGLVVPLVAVHLFVFYFGILADDTPPVGLAAYAASAISGADPIRTGIQGFTYDIRTAILPFMFIFNTQLLLIGIENWLNLLWTIVGAVSGMLVFSAATQGYWFVKNKWWETILLLLVAFSFFRPGYWWDEIYPAHHNLPPVEIYDHLSSLGKGEKLHLIMLGETLEGDVVSKHVLFDIENENQTPEEKLADIGLELRFEGDKGYVDNLVFGSQAEKAKIDFDWEVVTIQTDSERPAKQWVYLPVFLLLLVMAKLQKRREKQLGGFAG